MFLAFHGSLARSRPTDDGPTTAGEGSMDAQESVRPAAGVVSAAAHVRLCACWERQLP